MAGISKAALDEIARRLEARLEFLAKNPQAYRGNVACIEQAKERRRISRQEAVGNVVYVAAK